MEKELYLVLWKDAIPTQSHWTAYHCVFDNIEDAEYWLNEYKYNFGSRYGYKIAKLSFLD